MKIPKIKIPEVKKISLNPVKKAFSKIRKPEFSRRTFLIMILIAMVLVPASMTGLSVASKEKVCYDEICFNVKIANDNAERAKGLMFVENLEEDEGMLFIFNNSEKHSFWMKNTKIPLDIIWMNSDKKIVHIKHNAEPCESKYICETFAPDENAKYVLEINSGMAEELGMNETGNMSFINIKDKIQ